MISNVKIRTIPFSSVYPWLICGLAALFYCYEYLLRIAPSSMESELMSAFDITSNGVGLLSAFYFFAYAPMQLPCGVMMDKYGPRRILTMAVLCCALGASFMGLSVSANFYLFEPVRLAQTGRFFIGFGSAFAFVGVLKLASIWLPPDRFAFIAGLTTTLGMIGAMIGQNTMSRMVGELGIDTTLLYSSVVGFLLFPMIWAIIRDEPKQNQTSEESVSISVKHLMEDVVQVFSNKQIWINGLIGVFIMLPTTVFAELWGRLFLKTAYGFDGQLAVKATSMIFLGWAVGGPLSGFISDTLKNRKRPLMIGALIGACLMGLLIYGPMMSTSLLFVVLFLFGLISSVEVICFAVAKESSPSSVAGTAVAITNFLVVCAGPVQWFAGKLLDMSRSDAIDVFGNPIYTLGDFQFALCILPISMLMGFFLCFFLKETRCEQIIS